jgi:hypothetical protein
VFRIEAVIERALVVLAAAFVFGGGYVNVYRNNNKQCEIPLRATRREDWRTHNRPGFSFQTPLTYGAVTGAVQAWPEVLEDPRTKA